MNSKLTRALPAAAIAAVIALSASTGAVAAGMITGKDIKNSSVTSTDLKNNNVTGNDIKDGALTSVDLSAATVSALKGAAGPAGPAGAVGPAGPAGAAGAPGVSGLERVETTFSVLAGSDKALEVDCPAGKKILGLTTDWNTFTLTSTARFDADLGGGMVYGQNTTGTTKILRASATCATVG